MALASQHIFIVVMHFNVNNSFHLLNEYIYALTEQQSLLLRSLMQIIFQFQWEMKTLFGFLWLIREQQKAEEGVGERMRAEQLVSWLCMWRKSGLCSSIQTEQWEQPAICRYCCDNSVTNEHSKERESLTTSWLLLCGYVCVCVCAHVCLSQNILPLPYYVKVYFNNLQKQWVLRLTLCLLSTCLCYSAKKNRKKTDRRLTPAATTALDNKFMFLSTMFVCLIYQYGIIDCFRNTVLQYPAIREFGATKSCS